MSDADFATGAEARRTKQDLREASRGDATRQRIKLTARRLFATHGLGAVSIRQIVDASRQKNAGAVHYYFRSKDALIRELIVDVAELLESEKEKMLDALEASGRPIVTRDLLNILLHVPQTQAKRRDDHALRFLNMVMMSHRDLLFDALKDGVDRATRRCLAQLGRLHPELPAPILQQRLMLLVLDLFAVSSSREASREHPRVWRSLWGHPAARENVLDTLAGILSCPVSPETRRALRRPITARLG